jgi:60 kDa SS-A/Ro ribonucleoprotein
MALITANVEPMCAFVAFSHKLVPVTISPRQRLDDVLETLDGIRMGGTDCALPMLEASKQKWGVDAFVTYTDNETWAGRIHPVQALQKYRQESGIPAKLATVAMLTNDFTIADPNDAGTLDFVGFDLDAPAALSEFIRG